MKLDMHVHSKYSHDGSMSADKIISTALALGLDGVAVCDHDEFKAHTQLLSLAPPGFIVIPAVEYSTTAGHVLALFVSGLYALKRDGRGLCRLLELRAAADDDGALLVAAHPYRGRAEVPEELFETVDGIEVRNSRDDARRGIHKSAGGRANTHAALRRAASRYGKFITGGSDGHISREIGACYTALPRDTEKTPEGVRSALISRLSDAAGAGGRLTDQAVGKLLRTKPRTLPKDVARLVFFAATDVAQAVRGGGRKTDSH
ncbi:MAG: PHP domain-containing protein [Oscillospiraceae bacterium]|nr:PHP domain-containing protein [Oscillospiraceae bacterium]